MNNEMSPEVRQQIAAETLRHLGGRRAQLMIGAKNMMFGMNGELIFQLPNGIAKNKINRIKISVNGNDLYDIEYGYARGLNYKVVDTSTDIYVDGLVGEFESKTALFLHF